MTPADLTQFIDLTCLDENATESTIETLCDNANSVAAICIYPKFIPLVREHKKNILIATVANFPQGTDKLSTVLTEIEQAIKSGANEIDVVIPYHFYLSDERQKIKSFLTACRQTCTVTLKTILETGALNSAELIAMASSDAIDAGVDFIKTSTGKISTGATPEAAAIMLSAIKFSGASTGFKASGGIRQIDQALNYIQLAKNIVGENFLSPSRFRFGTSKLLA